MGCNELEITSMRCKEGNIIITVPDRCVTLSMALIGHALALIGRAQKPRLILAQKASLSLSSISCQPASFETGSKGNIDPVTNILLSFFSYLATHTLCAMYTARRGE